MSNTIIRVENLGKKYILNHQNQERYTALRDVLAGQAKSLKSRMLKPFDKRVSSSSREEFWALKDVSFEVKQGDRVGIIGRNGAGKSTLLKILSRITEPTNGCISIKGRVASLLEVGTGFHPELTGRENIYLNGAILGMSKREIKRKFDEVVAFAEVERFLDTPVKRYSSGMYVRLAFAVAAHLESEILVVDEVLAVGDAQFQKKCLGKMNYTSKNQGKTVLFVSHNINALSALCEFALLLDQGNIKYQGKIDNTINKYLASHLSNEEDIRNYRVNKQIEEINFTEIKIASESTKIYFAESIKFKLSISSRKAANNISIGGTVFNSSGNPIGAFISKEFNLVKNDSKIVRLGISKLNLAPGMYYMGFSVGSGNFVNTSRTDFDVIIGVPRFEILPFNDKTNIGTWNQAWGNIILNDYLFEY